MSVFSHLQVGSFRFEPKGKYHARIIYVALSKRLRRLKSGYRDCMHRLESFSTR